MIYLLLFNILVIVISTPFMLKITKSILDEELKNYTFKISHLREEMVQIEQDVKKILIDESEEM